MIHHCNRAEKAPCADRGHYILKWHDKVSKSMDALGHIPAPLSVPHTNKSTCKRNHPLDITPTAGHTGPFTEANKKPKVPHPHRMRHKAMTSSCRLGTARGKGRLIAEALALIGEQNI